MAEKRLRIKNWTTFQHYKNRRPPWVKLYRELLDDPEWHSLPPPAAKALVMMWLIASDDSGFLPAIKTLAFRLRVSEKDMESIVCDLSHWLCYGDASNTLANRLHDAIPEREGETEGETDLPASTVDTMGIYIHAREAGEDDVWGEDI
jgi:hypothetical protein